MDTGLDRVLGRYNLKQGDKVDVSLSAITHTSGDELNERGTTWSFRLDLKVNDIEKGRPIGLADVLRAPNESVNYGTCSIELLDVVAAMRDLRLVGRPPTHILEPFMDVPPVGLEDKMSSDGIFYVFSGFIEYARAIASRIKSEEEDAALFRGRVHLTPQMIDRLYQQSEDVYTGYRDFTISDLRSFESATGTRR
jgi:hypothetical protein